MKTKSVPNGTYVEVKRVLDCFLWNDLAPCVRAQLIATLPEYEHLPKGAELYRSGNLGYLAHGSGRILRLGAEGEATTVRTIAAGEIFGAAGVFGTWQGKSSIIANAPCQVRYISEEQLREMMSTHPQIAFNYIAHLSDRIRFLNRRMDTFSASSTEHKLYEYLRSQANQAGEVRLEYGMAELARRLKMGRSSLYRGLEMLEQNGFIVRNKNQFTII